MPHICRSSSEARTAIATARLLFLLVLLSVLPCAVCSAPFFRAATTPRVPAATETVVPAPGGQNKVVEAARIDLAGHINVDVAFLSVESVESLRWPDSCLGIGQPDEACEPVRTPGFRIVLAAGEYRFVYRTDLSGENVRLEDPVTSQADFSSAD